MIDLRVMGYRGPNSEEIEFWCGHTFLSVPLLVVLRDVKRFVEEHPSEVIVLEVRPDYSPINGDYGMLASREYSQVVRLVGRDNTDLLKFILSELESTLFCNFNVNMTLKDITKQKKKNVIMFFEGRLFPDKSIKYSSSWGKTRHHDSKTNIKNCKDWCQK